jgi:hypothetical protein
MAEQVPGWWEGLQVAQPGMEPYPMDYYAKDGGVWNSSYHRVSRSKVGKFNTGKEVVAAHAP